MAALNRAGRQTLNDVDGFIAKPQFDQYGFLIDPQLWSENAAIYIAELDGIGPLNTEHWRAIHFIRDRYLRLGAVPPLRNLCRGTGLSRVQLKALFGGCRLLWRIAGLPDPGEDIRNHLDTA